MFSSQQTGNLVSGSFSLELVFLSYVIAVLASYTALSLTSCTKDSVHFNKKLWIVECAIAMGCGIWSMHFTAMLSYKMPIPVSYDFKITLLSLGFAVVASGYGLFHANTAPVTKRKVVTGGMMMGIGIAAMHYCGMAAMQMEANVSYSPGLFLFSIVIAIVAATSALWLLIYGNANQEKNIAHFKGASALLMGMAVFGMHFTGMAAMSVTTEKLQAIEHMVTTDFNVLLVSVLVFTVVIFGLAIFASNIQEEFMKLRLVKEQAEMANLAKTQFLSRMSHELRTPMNAILGFGQLMDMDPQLTEKQRKCLNQIMWSGNHLLELINDVLDLARIESGNFDLSFESHSVPKIVEPLVEMVQPLVAENEVVFENQAQHFKSLNAWGDLTRIRQILLNLLSNSIKYNNRNGKVTLACKDAGNHKIDIIVTDEGPGIEEFQIERLFLPFERLGMDNSMVEGTGIGMSICKDLAKKMKGDILVESWLGKGSQFTLRLPAVDPDIIPEQFQSEDKEDHNEKLVG